MAAASPNPLHAIATLVASLHDEKAGSRSPASTTGVAPPDPAIARAIAARPFNEENYLPSIGAPARRGRAGTRLLERQWLRPTLELNGMWGGYGGAGHQDRHPDRGRRQDHLPPGAGQEPDEIVALISAHLAQHCPAGVTLDITRPATAPSPMRSRRPSGAGAGGGRAGRALRQAAAPRAMGATVPDRPHLPRARSAPRPCSSPSPRRTRTITRPTSSSGCRAFATASIAWARALAALGDAGSRQPLSMRRHRAGGVARDRLGLDLDS